MKSIVLTLLVTAPALLGQETVLELNPSHTRVEFTLSDVLHTVHGSFQLKRGTVRYDLKTGKCSGEIVIDAQSGNSGSEARDKRMHKNILESAQYPEIVFMPDQVTPDKGGPSAAAKVHGMFTIHGARHEMTMTVEANRAGDAENVKAHFVVPYVQWGMKNPSTLFLRVGDTVNIDVDAHGAIRSGE
jgi:polyisoprenoid-binding protein YceI